MPYSQASSGLSVESGTTQLDSIVRLITGRRVAVMLCLGFLLSLAMASGAAAGGGSPPRGLLSALEQCVIPTESEASVALQEGPFGSYNDFTHLKVRYNPAPPPPYGVAPEYKVPQFGCDYESAAGVTYFSVGWFTNSAWLHRFGQSVPGIREQKIPLPRHALAAYESSIAIAVLYPGVWIQWADIKDPTLNAQIERAIAAHF